MPTSQANQTSGSASKLSITGLHFQFIAAMSNPCSFRIMTPAPVLCKSSKTAPSKYTLYIGLLGGFRCSVRLIPELLNYLSKTNTWVRLIPKDSDAVWDLIPELLGGFRWVVELPELQIAWNSCQNSIASPAMTLGCSVDCLKTHLFLAFQIIQDSIRNCSSVVTALLQYRQKYFSEV